MQKSLHSDAKVGDTYRFTSGKQCFNVTLIRRETEKCGMTCKGCRQWQWLGIIVHRNEQCQQDGMWKPFTVVSICLETNTHFEKVEYEKDEQVSTE